MLTKPPSNKCSQYSTMTYCGDREGVGGMIHEILEGMAVSQNWGLSYKGFAKGMMGGPYCGDSY